MRYIYPYHPSGSGTIYHYSDEWEANRFGLPFGDQSIPVAFNNWFNSLGLQFVQYLPNFGVVGVAYKYKDQMFYHHEDTIVMPYGQGAWQFSANPEHAPNACMLLNSELISIEYLSDLVQSLDASQPQEMALVHGGLFDNVPNMYPYVWIHDGQYLYFENEDQYQDFERSHPGVLEVFRDAGCSPQALFYAQYLSYNDITPQMYTQMLGVDVDDRSRMLITSFDAEGHLSVKVKQSDPYARVSQLQGELRNGGLGVSFVAESQYACQLQDGSCVLLALPSPVSMLIPPVGKIKDGKWNNLYNYHNVAGSLRHNMLPKRWFVSEYCFRAHDFEGNHALLSRGPSPQSVNTRAIKQGIGLEIEAITQEAWHEPIRCQKLMPSEPTKWKDRLWKYAIGFGLLVLWLVFEIVAAVRKWRISAGIFHQQPVWLLGLFCGLTVLFSLCAYRWWRLQIQKSKEYQPKSCAYPRNVVAVDQGLWQADAIQMQPLISNNVV